MKNCLIISDTHFPYEHPSTFKFLEAIKDVYDIQLVKHSGDMVDNHTGSFHDNEYGALSPKEEHDQAYKKVQRLSEIFPKMDVVIGNHGAMSERKAKTAGIPLDHLKSYNDMYDVKWNWADRFYFKIDKDTDCLLVHSMSTNTLNNAAKHSHCSIQGHHHSKFGIEYFTDTNMIRWSMTVGCLVDLHHPAFNYASGATLSRQVIGCGAIIENRPILVPMVLNKSGKWNGKL